MSLAANIFKRIAPDILKGLAKKANGKKTITGALLVAGGAGLMNFQETRGIGIDFILTGVPILVTGIIHKILKWRQK